MLELEDKDGQMVEIFLDDEGNIKVPVPRLSVHPGTGLLSNFSDFSGRLFMMRKARKVLQ